MDTTYDEILVNAIRTPDGTLLRSRHRHDYVTHTDANGEWYMVDGGMDYLRGSVNTIQPEYLFTTTADTHDTIRNRFEWGSYGKEGKDPLHYILLKDMEDSHIRACLETQSLIPKIRKVFEDELEFRDVSSSTG